MEWWQILLIFLVSLGVGMLVGTLLDRLIKRFSKKRKLTLMVEEQMKYNPPELIEEIESNRKITTEPRTDKLLSVQTRIGTFWDRLIKRFSKKRKLTLMVEEQMKYTPPELIEEIESNRKITTEPKTDKLLSFQTHVWDLLQDEINTLPTNLKEGLVQVYLDIRLANSIVRLSTEFGHRSPNLDESYMKVCTTIADRIDRLNPLMKPPEIPQ